MAFPVTCPSCGKAFQLATEIYERKVAGKIVSIKCKQCQSGIRVDATQPGELKVIGATPPGGGDLSVGPRPPLASSSGAAVTTGGAAAAAEPAKADEPKPAPAPVRMRQPTLIGMVSPAAKGGPAFAPRPAAPAPAPATPALWAVDSGGTGDDRELSDDEIRREIQSGNLGPQTLAWREGMAEWLEIEKIPELSRHLAPPAREEPKPPPRAPQREVPALDERPGFQEEPDAEATKVYDRSAPDAAMAPFALPEDPDLTTKFRVPPGGPFAKTTPLADAPPPPPLPAAGRPAAFAKTTPLADAPPPPLPAAVRPPPPARPMEASPPPPPVKAAPPPAAPAFPAAPALPATAAPPAAPAMPVAPALPAAPAPVLAAVPWGDALPSAKPQAPTLPTAPYGPDPFAVAATTDLDFPTARSKKPIVIAAVVGVIAVLVIGIVIASSSSPPVANVAVPPPVATKPPDEPKPKEPEPTEEPVHKDSQEPAAPAAQVQAPNGNFSDMFSKGAKGAGSGQAGQAFDEAQARDALSGALKAAAACKEPGGPTGQTTATVTFEPSGNVSAVTVGAPFAGSSTGTCLITAFKRAKVAPFTGLPKTVSQSISLR